MAKFPAKKLQRRIVEKDVRSRFKGEEVQANNLRPGDVIVLENANQTELLRGNESLPVVGQVESWSGIISSGYLTTAWRQRKDFWVREQMMLNAQEKFYRLTGTMQGVVRRSNLEHFKPRLGESLVKPGLLTGADPELFAVNWAGKLMPAFEFLPSGKDIKGTEAAYWDGAQLEFRVVAGHCLDGFVTSCRAGLYNALYNARKVDPKARLKLASVMDVELGDMDKWKEEHVAFGCSPSLNAYDDFAQLMGADPKGILWRPAGGHLHFGMWALTNEATAREVVKVLDKVIGVVATSLFAKYDDPRRRMLYGKAGEYRLPEHGLEYRVLSPMWLSSPGVAQLVFEIARMSVGMALRGLGNAWESSEEETRGIINDTNWQAAREVIKRNEDVLKGILRACYSRRPEFTYPNLKVALYAILNGVETVSDPEMVEHNWDLENMHGAMKHARWSMLAEAMCPKLGI